MINGAEQIIKYIPQRKPIVMIDTIIHVDEKHGITALTITIDNIFVENNLLREAGIIEHIAQSAAAGLGYQYKQINKPVPLGFIASIRDLVIKKLPKTGEKLITSVTTTNKILGITIVQSETKSGNDIVASCEMRIFTKEDNDL